MLVRVGRTADISQFDVTTGAVLRGPATRPVRSRVVEVQGLDLTVDA
jgi:Rieske Fe-S protein